jgi:hypothetical protein
MSKTTIVRGNVLSRSVIAPSLTPAEVLAAITAVQNFTVKGLQTTDLVRVHYSGAQTAGVFVCSSRVSAADTLAVTFANVTAGALTPAAGAYNVQIDSPEDNPLPVNAV